MYLFVFVFLVMSVVGLYTQVYAMQAAKAYQNMTGAAQIMLTWHNGAKRWVQDTTNLANLRSTSIIQNNKATDGTGCYLIKNVTTPADTLNNPHVCGLKPNDMSTKWIMLQPTSSKYLPADYNYTGYRFRTIVYTPQTGPYQSKMLVMTFIPPDPVDPRTPVAGGFTLSQIAQQFNKMKLEPIYYGFVRMVSSQLVIETKSGDRIFAPTIPAGQPPIGSLVVISRPNV